MDTNADQSAAEATFYAGKMQRRNEVTDVRTG